MTKRDILKFLERKQDEKRTAVREEYFARREQVSQNAYNELGLTALADQIQPLLAEACRLWEKWRNEHENLGYISFRSHYNSLNSNLYDYTSSNGATLCMLVEHDVKLETAEMENARKEYNAQFECVNNTFHTVISTVQNMKSAKQAAVYLKELGFDLSEIGNPAEQVQTALMVPVDTRFLFVKQAA